MTSIDKREDPLPELPVRAINRDAWEHFFHDPAYVADRWSDTGAAVVRFFLGASSLIALASIPARSVWGEETFPGDVPGGVLRLGKELEVNGARELMPETIIDGIFLDADKPDPPLTHLTQCPVGSPRLLP